MHSEYFRAAGAGVAPDFVADAIDTSRGDIGHGSGGRLVAAIALAGVVGAIVMLVSTVRPDPSTPPPAAVAAFDPSRFILNALLVPALDGDAVPLRWADPRTASHCGPATELRVNDAPLVAGAPLPDQPFELEWRADGCRPLGINGPRYDGRVRLTVYRENWGLSAIVQPSGLQVRFAGHEATLTQRIGAWLLFDGAGGADGEPIELAAIGEGQ